MGYDAACTLGIDGRRYSGTARLESTDLTFRGDIRVTIPFARISEVRAHGGDLLVTFGGKQAVLEIGNAAEKWARRIANPPSRLDKLGVKAGMRVSVLHVHDPSIGQEIQSRGATLVGQGDHDQDLIFLGVHTPGDLAALEPLKARLKPAGAIWLVRPKGKSTGVTESASMAAGKRAGLVDVKVVSFSETHSAEKYVIPVAKRARPSRPSPVRRKSESVPLQARRQQPRSRR